MCRRILALHARILGFLWVVRMEINFHLKILTKMTKEELIKSYEKRKASLEIYRTGILVKEIDKLKLGIQIDCFSKFIEELKILDEGRSASD